MDMKYITVVFLPEPGLQGSMEWTLDLLEDMVQVSGRECALPVSRGQDF